MFFGYRTKENQSLTKFCEPSKLFVDLRENKLELMNEISQHQIVYTLTAARISYQVLMQVTVTKKSKYK